MPDFVANFVAFFTSQFAFGFQAGYTEYLIVRVSGDITVFRPVLTWCGVYSMYDECVPKWACE